MLSIECLDQNCYYRRRLRETCQYRMCSVDPFVVETLHTSSRDVLVYPWRMVRKQLKKDDFEG